MSLRSYGILVPAVVTAVLPLTAGGRAAPRATTARPPDGPLQEAPCNGPEHRQFDFWLGDWEVRAVADGRLAGTNEITSILDGCVLMESYSTPTGYAGHSFNAYDASTGQWHQTWVDNTGLVLKLDGGLDGEGRMVLSGPGVDPRGNEVVNRIVWTPREDGSVQQTWDMSPDSGATWRTVFDGMYRLRG